MKHLIIITLLVSSIYANGTFEKNKEYRCENTYNIHNGKQISANALKAKIQSFSFTIKRKLLITSNNIIYDFITKRGPRLAYSNIHYLLLLTSDMELGLVPKKQKGAIQFYFSCK